MLLKNTLILIFLFLFSYSVCHGKVEVVNDVVVGDLELYLGSLKKIVEGCSVHTRFTEPNYYFGLFIAKVNLQRALRDNYEKLDKVAIEYVGTIIEKINGLLKFIKLNEIPKMTAIERSIFSLIQNETSWIEGLRPIQIIPSQNQQRGSLPDWQVYDNFVNDYERGVPSPEQSDICLTDLSKNEVVLTTDYHSNFKKCLIDDLCYGVLVNGTNFGYFLTHRMLPFILANLGRGCSISSPSEDLVIIRLFCTTARNEALYNMKHGFRRADLVLEQMSLCGIYGYPTITDRDWLNDFLTLQTPSGCLANPRLNENPGRRKFGKKVGDFHLSSVTASTLGTVVRFILEKY